jgi:ATP-dependent RNA helicase RhlE
VQESLKAELFLELLKRDEIGNVIVFTRTKHRANRLATSWRRTASPTPRSTATAASRSAPRRWRASRAGKFRVLVATDIVARGIDVEALEHVVNFDVPHVPEDYIHRVGRTARAEATGDAYTFVSPTRKADLRAIERAVGKKLPRVTVADFDYNHKPRSASRSRSPSGSPRSARASRKSAPAPRPRPSARRRWRPRVAPAAARAVPSRSATVRAPTVVPPRAAGRATTVAASTPAPRMGAGRAAGAAVAADAPAGAPPRAQPDPSGGLIERPSGCKLYVVERAACTRSREGSIDSPPRAHTRSSSIR